MLFGEAVCIPWVNFDKAIEDLAELRLSLAIRVTLRFKDKFQGCPLQPAAIRILSYERQDGDLLQDLEQCRVQAKP